MIVCLAANPSVDKLFEIQRLVRGDIHRPEGFVPVPGGKGLTAARAATLQRLSRPQNQALPALRGGPERQRNAKEAP